MQDVSRVRVAITGGSGFIGTNLVDHFVARGAEVLSLDVSPPRKREHAPYWRKADLLDVAGIRHALHGFRPHFLLHMAARTDLDGSSVSDYAVNVEGVQNLISAIQGLDTLQRVVFGSSRMVCRIGYRPGNDTDYCPSTPYGESKVVGEQIIRAAAGTIACSWTIVRPTSIWGPWFDVPYKTFFVTIGKGRYFHPGSAKILKSFGFVGNTVYQLQRLIDAPPSAASGRTFYLADYPPIDIAEMATEIRRALGAPRIRTVDPQLLRLAAWAGDALKAMGISNPPLTSFRLRNLMTPMIYDLQPLQAAVGTLPYSMTEGIAITVRWLKQYQRA